jgi:hypothetical protein
MTEIARCLEKRYGHRGDVGKQIIVHVEELWREFIPIAHPAALVHLQKELCSEDWNKFCQRYWELLLGRHLRICGLSPHARSTKGPDFHTTRDQLTIWIEAVAPSKGAEQIWVPSGQIPSSDGDQGASWFQTDHEAILRRWTAALKEKHDRLLGYFDKGIVTSDEAYVIALNSCLLLGLDALHGSSGLPSLVEVLFGASMPRITLDRKTRERVSVHHDFRESVLSKKGSAIPTAIFLNEDYKRLSAILATVAIPDTVALHGDPYIIIAHNPLAHSKIPTGILGASEEWIVDDLQPAHVDLRRLK